MPASLFFLGDSHVRCMAQAAIEQGFRVMGGPFASGGYWGDGSFELGPSGIIFPDDVSRALLEGELRRAEVASVYDLKIPLITTCGFHVRNGLIKLERYWTGETEIEGRIFLSDAVFSAAVLAMRARHLEFIRRLREAGVRVIMIPSPPRLGGVNRDLSIRFEDAIFGAAAPFGVEFIRPREFCCNRRGRFREEYASPADKNHANVAYGHEIVNRVRRLLGDVLEPAASAGTEDDPDNIALEKKRRRLHAARAAKA